MHQADVDSRRPDALDPAWYPARPGAVTPDLLRWFILPDGDPVEDPVEENPAPEEMQMGSTLKKRKSMMNKHKLKKRRKRDRMKKRVIQRK